MAVDDAGDALAIVFGGSVSPVEVLRHFVPRDVEVEMGQLRIVEQALHDLALLLDGAHHATEAKVRPDDRRSRVTFEHRLQIGQVGRAIGRLGEGDVDVVVNQDHQPRLAREIRMRSSAGFRRLGVPPAIFPETNSLWMLNSPMPENTSGKSSSTRRM